MSFDARQGQKRRAADHAARQRDQARGIRVRREPMQPVYAGTLRRDQVKLNQGKV